MIRKKKKTYYIGLNESKNINICLTKTALAQFLGISVDTIRRRLNNQSSYHCDEYSIWSGVTIPKLKRGFAIKLPNKYNY